MATFYPVIVTAAIFIALILNDIMVQNSSNVPLHILEGIVSIALMVFLSMRDMEIVSWGLLLLVLLVLIICYFLAEAEGDKSAKPMGTPHPSSPMMSCSIIGDDQPTIGTPSSPTMSAEIKSAPYTFTPITSCANST